MTGESQQQQQQQQPNDYDDVNDDDGDRSMMIDYKLLLPQCIVGLVDAISFMVVAPSIIFYVLEMGGNKEQYGLILSSFSFASFSFKPILGYWCDRAQSFRAPYLTSILIAAIGGLVYFIASIVPPLASSWALHLVLLGRLLGGVGAANSTLGFTYIAKVVPQQQMTKANAVLSMVRVFGMALAPALNIFLDKVNVTVGNVHITPLNSIGLVLFFGNLLSYIVMHIWLEEPPPPSSDDDDHEDGQQPSAHDNDVDTTSKSSWYYLAKSMLSLDILLYILTIFALNANFQLLETGLAPASSHALGWTPVEISTMFGINAIFIFVVILLTFQLSSMGVSDAMLLEIGLTTSLVGYLLLYLWWKSTSSLFQFVLPVVLSTMAFPFMGSPTRSLFTQAVAANVHLRKHVGSMQAVLSMSASVAGFAAPGLIAAFILRTPEQVEQSRDHREMTNLALFAPILSLVLLVGVLCLRLSATKQQPADQGELLPTVGEATSLLSPDATVSELSPELHIPTRFPPRIEAHRRHSVALMGIPQISFHEENRRRRNTVIIGSKDSNPHGRHSVYF